MSYNLFLDDIREPWMVGNYIYPVELRSQYRLEEWIVVRNYHEFLKIIEEKGLPDKISFDHDLADEHYGLVSQSDFLSLEEYYEFQDRELTGYDCAKWLCGWCGLNKKSFPEYYVHSANPVGAENIKKYIENFNKYEQSK